MRKREELWNREILVPREYDLLVSGWIHFKIREGSGDENGFETVSSRRPSFCASVELISVVHVVGVVVEHC